MSFVNRLEPNSEYQIYVVNPYKTKFGDTYVVFDHVHKKHFLATKKVKDFIEENGFIGDNSETGELLFTIKTKEYKLFKKGCQMIKYLDLNILK